MKYLIIIISIIIFSLIHIADKKRLGNLVSPSFCFFVPTFSVALIYDFIGPLLGFYEMDYRIYYEVTLATIVFYIGGLFLKPTYPKSIQIPNIIYVNKVDDRYCVPKWLLYISILICFTLYVRISSLGGLQILQDEELQKIYGSGSFFGHVLVMAIFLLCFYLSFSFVENRVSALAPDAVC